MSKQLWHATHFINMHMLLLHTRWMKIWNELQPWKFHPERNKVIYKWKPSWNEIPITVKVQINIHSIDENRNLFTSVTYSTHSIKRNPQINYRWEEQSPYGEGRFWLTRVIIWSYLFLQRLWNPSPGPSWVFQLRFKHEWSIKILILGTNKTNPLQIYGAIRDNGTRITSKATQEPFEPKKRSRIEKIKRKLSHSWWGGVEENTRSVIDN